MDEHRHVWLSELGAPQARRETKDAQCSTCRSTGKLLHPRAALFRLVARCDGHRCAHRLSCQPSLLPPWSRQRLVQIFKGAGVTFQHDAAVVIRWKNDAVATAAAYKVCAIVVRPLHVLRCHRLRVARVCMRREQLCIVRRAQIRLPQHRPCRLYRVEPRLQVTIRGAAARSEVMNRPPLCKRALGQ